MKQNRLENLSLNRNKKAQIDIWKRTKLKGIVGIERERVWNEREDFLAEGKQLLNSESNHAVRA